MDRSNLTVEQQERLDKRKIEIRIENERYLRAHPEIKKLLANFTSTVLERRPGNILHFASHYFTHDSSRQALLSGTVPVLGPVGTCPGETAPGPLLGHGAGEFQAPADEDADHAPAPTATNASENGVKESSAGGDEEEEEVDVGKISSVSTIAQGAADLMRSASFTSTGSFHSRSGESGEPLVDETDPFMRFIYVADTHAPLPMPQRAGDLAMVASFVDAVRNNALPETHLPSLDNTFFLHGGNLTAYSGSSGLPFVQASTGQALPAGADLPESGTGDGLLDIDPAQSGGPYPALQAAVAAGVDILAIGASELSNMTPALFGDVFARYPVTWVCSNLEWDEDISDVILTDSQLAADVNSNTLTKVENWNGLEGVDSWEGANCWGNKGVRYLPLVVDGKLLFITSLVSPDSASDEALNSAGVDAVQNDYIGCIESAWNHFHEAIGGDEALAEWCTCAVLVTVCNMNDDEAYGFWTDLKASEPLSFYFGDNFILPAAHNANAYTAAASPIYAPAGNWSEAVVYTVYPQLPVDGSAQRSLTTRPRDGLYPNGAYYALRMPFATPGPPKPPSSVSSAAWAAQEKIASTAWLAGQEEENTPKHEVTVDKAVWDDRIVPALKPDPEATLIAMKAAMRSKTISPGSIHPGRLNAKNLTSATSAALLASWYSYLTGGQPGTPESVSWDSFWTLWSGWAASELATVQYAEGIGRSLFPDSHEAMDEDKFTKWALSASIITHASQAPSLFKWVVGPWATGVTTVSLDNALSCLSMTLFTSLHSMAIVPDSVAAVQATQAAWKTLVASHTHFVNPDRPLVATFEHSTVESDPSDPAAKILALEMSTSRSFTVSANPSTICNRTTLLGNMAADVLAAGGAEGLVDALVAESLIAAEDKPNVCALVPAGLLGGSNGVLELSGGLTGADVAAVVPGAVGKGPWWVGQVSAADLAKLLASGLESKFDRDALMDTVPLMAGFPVLGGRFGIVFNIDDPEESYLFDASLNNSNTHDGAIANRVADDTVVSLLVPSEVKDGDFRYSEASSIDVQGEGWKEVDPGSLSKHLPPSAAAAVGGTEHAADSMGAVWRAVLAGSLTEKGLLGAGVATPAPWNRIKVWFATEDWSSPDETPLGSLYDADVYTFTTHAA